MASNDRLQLSELMVNHEDRLNQLEHQVGILQNRMPKSKTRRVFWLVSSTLWLVAPIIGGLVAFFGEDPWKGPIVTGAFGILIGRAISNFAITISQSPLPHRSLLVDDHR